jgi:hypothetical protein
MKTSILPAGVAGVGFTGIVLVAAVVGTDAAGAETYSYGGSTATIEQSGGSGPSESEVTRFPDGQKIITRDGNNTDITIQRSGDELPPDTDLKYLKPGDDRFDRRFMEERFSRRDRNEPGDDYCYDNEPSYTRDEFRQRMLERMGSDLLP